MENDDKNAMETEDRSQWRPKNAMETEYRNGGRRQERNGDRRTQWRPNIAMEDDDKNAMETDRSQWRTTTRNARLKIFDVGSTTNCLSLLFSEVEYIHV